MKRIKLEETLNKVVTSLREFYPNRSDLEIVGAVLTPTTKGPVRLNAERVADFFRGRRGKRFSTGEVTQEFKVPSTQAAAAIAILSLKSKIRKVGVSPSDRTSLWEFTS